MIKVLVTGASGQLGLCIKNKSKSLKNLDFSFLDSTSLDITNNNQIKNVFDTTSFDYCINCAAYTAVDKAEEDMSTANAINNIAVKNLAEACHLNNTTLVHISTDFVFDGLKTKPYSINDATNPIGVYGDTKLKGEKEIVSILKKYYIIRTSWLYSEHKNNFVKTMLRLANEKDELNIVNDQKGTPTNANDLADVIVKIIESNSQSYGLYHFSNLGQTTWYGFAKAIFELSNITIKTNPVTSDAFITKAKRPSYSVLDKTKIITNFGLAIPGWRKSLENHLKNNGL